MIDKQPKPIDNELFNKMGVVNGSVLRGFENTVNTLTAKGLITQDERADIIGFIQIVQMRHEHVLGDTLLEATDGYKSFKDVHSVSNLEKLPDAELLHVCQELITLIKVSLEINKQKISNN